MENAIYANAKVSKSWARAQAEAFDCEDPAIPEVRAILAWMRTELIGLHEKLGSAYGEKVELPEPDDLRVEAIRRIAHWPEQRTNLSDGELMRHIEPSTCQNVMASTRPIIVKKGLSAFRHRSDRSRSEAEDWGTTQREQQQHRRDQHTGSRYRRWHGLLTRRQSRRRQRIHAPPVKLADLF